MGYRLPSSAALIANTDFSRHLVSRPVESGWPAISRVRGFIINDAAADEMVVASDDAGNMIGQVSDPGSLSHHLTIADDG